MKITKIIGTLLLSAQVLVAAQTIHSSFIEFDDYFEYTYSVDRTLFERDISHFQIYVCDTAIISNPMSNIGFTLSFDSNIYKFDNLESDNQPTTIWFSFESPNIPTLKNALIKAGQSVYNYEDIYGPSCTTIPEPKTTMFGLFGTLLLLRRRR